MKNYVVGLVTNHERTKICLVRKIKPEYLTGLWNGPGGKVEEKETPTAAMIRELYEETGILAAGITPGDNFIVMDCARKGERESWRIHFFDIKLPEEKLLQAKKLEEEEVRVWSINEALSSFSRGDKTGEYTHPVALVPNFYWIIPYLCNAHRREISVLYASETWPAFK